MVVVEFAALFGTGFAWAVPGLLLSVPGMLLVLAITAQAAGALVWLPLVRRRIGGFGGSVLGSCNAGVEDRAWPTRALDARRDLRPYSADITKNAGCERDEYPSHVDPEIRRLV